MPTTALTQPTGAEIVDLFSPQDGTKDTIGVFDIVAIDAHVTANGASSIPAIEFEWMKALLTANSYTHTALDDTAEYPYAWNALRQACYLRFLDLDRSSKILKGEECEPKEQYECRRKIIKDSICENLRELSISDTRYCLNQFSLYDIDIVKPC